MQNNRVELLAPAGNPEGFYGAVHAGADAVYLGGSRFGARAYADNFTTEELVSCIRYAHLWGRKVYLTVNTLVKEAEFGELYYYLLPYYEAGLDGVIVQDIGVFSFIREHFPNMELHVSTQMTLTGAYGAAMLRDMGACRIVPARELSLKEIAHIKEQTELSIETFIHGAMCYCYSGQCLFSSILGGRSGNRGRCAQPCRLPYEVNTSQTASGECYPLSLKDMCTIEHIPELIQAGIDSFKIEGRMKKAEYTAGVTAIYRKYIDKYYAGEKSFDGQIPNRKKTEWKIAASDFKALSCLYIRSERQDGYYYKHNGKDMVTLTNPAYSGSDEEMLTRIRRKYLEEKPKRSVSVHANFITGSMAYVTYILEDKEDINVTVAGNVVQTASKQPISRENIAKQLGKLGDSIFAADTMEISVSDDAFYSLKEINELRREAVANLENILIRRNGFSVCRADAVPPDTEDCAVGTQFNARKPGGRLFVSIHTKEQMDAVMELMDIGNSKIARLYLDGDLFLGNAEATDKALAQCQKLANQCELIIALPYIIRRKDIPLLERRLFPLLESSEYRHIFVGALVRSMEGMGILKTKGYQGKIYTDAGFYIWNRRTLQEWKDTITGFCMPLELTSGEQKPLLTEQIPCEKIVYGRIPMMITANCVANTTEGCLKGTGEKTVLLTDRYRKKFPVELNCIHCMNIIYNSVPLSLHGELAKWKGQTDFRLEFGVETKQETKEVLEYFLGIQQSDYRDVAKPPYKDYTTGHEKRGVE